jgi:hypothetical protein
VSRELVFTLPGTLLFGLVLGLSGRHVPLLGGAQAPNYAAVATLLCLLPSLLTVRLHRRIQSGPANQQLLMLLSGTGIRMAGALFGSLLLAFLWPAFQQAGFWINLLLVYLFSLAIEIRLLVRSLPRPEPTQTLASGLDR